MTIYYFPNGQASRNPVTRQQAIEVKSLKYNDGKECVECGMTSPKYTSNGVCMWCARKNAMSFYNFYSGSDFIWTDEDTGEHFSQPEYNGELVEISEEKWQEWSRMGITAQSDAAYTVATGPCKSHGHVGMKRLGKCYECHVEKSKPSPRQAAIAAGERYFMPLIPCPRCMKTALKRVNGSVCTGCIDADVNTTTDHRETPDTIMMRDNPDMTISKEDAITYGFKVYRTGGQCRKGHTGWRYASTGSCIPCLRGEE